MYVEYVLEIHISSRSPRENMDFKLIICIYSNNICQNCINMTYETIEENHQQQMTVEERLEKEHRIKKDLMRILHIWNTAGVGGLIARYMDRYYGTESFCVMRSSHDPFDLMTKGKVYDEKAIKWYIRIILMSRKYDVLHLHGLDNLISIFKLLYPSKKIIIHYHGSKIRNKWDTRKRYWKSADHILVSTPDLLEGSPKNAIYIPNIIDEDLVKSISGSPKKKGSAFHVDRFARARARVLEYPYSEGKAGHSNPT